MPTISKIRFTHVLYENGNKRYNNETFEFHGHNGAVVLENGGGKTVFIQTALQAIIPHADVAGRKLKETLQLDQGPAHIAIEWILADKPRRRYVTTCVTLFQSGNGIDSYRYLYEYGEHDAHRLDELPFVRPHLGKLRPADKGEMQDYYSSMEQRYPLQAKSFPTIRAFRSYLEEHYRIIAGEWDAIVKINETEGGIEGFFEECKTTAQLFDRLLIPAIEEAMEGFERDKFARMFETHREGFKQYKELKEQIAENKQILRELGHYAGLFAQLGQAEESYAEARAEAKAYWRLCVEQAREVKEDLRRLSDQEADWGSRREQATKRRKSLIIARKEEERHELAQRERLAEAELGASAKQQQDAEVDYYSVQYAVSREKQQLAASRCRQLGEQLARMTYTADEQELARRWEVNGGELRQLFLTKEESLAKRLAESAETLAELTEQRQAGAGKRKELERQIAEEGKAIMRLTETLRSRNEEMERIARSILANPQLDRVEQQVPLWAAEEQRLENSRIETLQELKALEEARAACEGQRKRLNGEYSTAVAEETRFAEQLAHWEREQEEVKQELVLLYPAWERLSSLYEKQATVTERLGEQIERRREQKRQLLAKERIAYRYVDDHGGQSHFFADAAVARLCEQWSHQFSLLQLGTDYLRSFGDDATGLRQNEAGGGEERGGEEERAGVKGLAASDRAAVDRLWAITLITTGQEKPALSAKLAQSGSFAFPIRLLTVQEAADAMRGLNREVREQTERGDTSGEESAPQRGEWVVPEHWLSNAEPSRFAEWKADLTRQADRVKLERERVEGELAEWQAAGRKLQAFLDRYPLAGQQELQQKRLATQARIAALARELEGLDQSLELNRQTIEKRKAAMEEMGNAILQHGIWLQNGRQYLLFRDEGAKLTQELVPLRGRQQLLEEQKAQEERAEARLLKKLEEERQRQQDVQLQLQLLRRDEWYDKVQGYALLPADGLIEEWKAARRDLELERLRIVQERSQLEEQLAREQERVSELGKAMDSLRREHGGLLPDRELPADVHAHQSASWQRIEELRTHTDSARREYEQADRRLREQQGAIATLLQQYAEQFGAQEPERLDEPLDQAEATLKEAELSLADEGEQLKQQLARTNRLGQELDKVLELWNKHLLVHQLEDVRLTPAIIGEADRTEFAYKRMPYVEASIAKLSAQQKEFMDNRSRMLEGRQHFKDFCIKKVNDVKLRQMTLQGIDTKERYEEIREFQQAMEQRIQMAIHIAEQNLQTRDQEQQQYIQHIHAHLRQVVHELKEVPKKTRVNTEDGWRDIYSFAIPEWEEQDGKERIRGHLDWIMDKLDGYAEKGQADWQEQQTAMRKDLDKWLDTRALLQMVLQGEGMKVSCRKVTNDQQVTRASYSWEQSNRWSGGEKWSKNMTLFLGLLNYVAEKKHYIEARMKRHRTVILDNPFGKASSDHVLSPVFFIAEQLGFQFIALTAHVEGKFLQDYFPIVYSCRLRHAADSSKQIIEAAQQVQTAYFRDHDPLTLERIGQRVSQLELF